MDYPTAVAIFVPVSTLVVTIGAIFLKKTNKKNPNPGGVSRKELDGLLKEKLDSTLCEERVKRIEGSFETLKGFIEQQFEWMKRKLEKIP